jgi:hypothetical protein
MLRVWLQRAQPLLLLLALVVVALWLRSQWDELRAYPWRLHAGWLMFSAILMLTAWAVEVTLWRRILAVIGTGLPFWAAWRIWFLTILVRYVPGAIWQPLSIVIYCQQWQIRPEATLTSLVLYQVVTLLAVGPIAAVYFWLSGNWGLLTGLLGGYTSWLAGLALLPVALFFLRPGWLLALINWGLRRVGRDELDAKLTTRKLGALLGLGIASWLLWGTVFAALTFGLRTYSGQEMLRLAPHLVAVYSVGYAIGLVTLIAPGGFGVREGALYLLLAPKLDGGALTIAILAMRVWTLLLEIVIAALIALDYHGWLLLRPRRPFVVAQSPVLPAVGEPPVE